MVWLDPVSTMSNAAWRLIRTRMRSDPRPTAKSKGMLRGSAFPLPFRSCGRPDTMKTAISVAVLIKASLRVRIGKTELTRGLLV